jgi:hypothetical protein
MLELSGRIEGSGMQMTGAVSAAKTARAPVSGAGHRSARGFGARPCCEGRDVGRAVAAAAPAER